MAYRQPTHDEAEGAIGRLVSAIQVSIATFIAV